ncbi:MAG: multifunctional CCA addition/repair protein [Wenzhouxiangella sp.]|nr:MAG: multifunctional CCA addition/repair protein [Wenzhouxiangella sp.]
MDIYQVGGSVRDRLLGLEPGDRDWVVVGSSPEEMIARGFRPVGRDFPVFLHPRSGEEYALARTERKQGRGYHGFVFHTGPEVTLEADLARRDLTINAMALTGDDRLIDPYNGRIDLELGVLRHVSDAFREDPVRILRLARFAACFEDFSVADPTVAVCREMVADGEVAHLVPERVWQEMSRALMCARPSRFITVLREVGALKVVLPEVDALFGVPQAPEHHPEIDSGRHTLMVLEKAAELGGALPARFAALVHDLGKAATPREQWPAHHGHEHRGVGLIRSLCERLRVPNDCRELALLVGEFHLLVHRAAELKPATLVRLLERLDLFRRPERLEPFLLACQADYRGRLGLEDRAYPQAERIRHAFAAARQVEARALVEQGLEGAAIGEGLRRERIDRVRRALAD